MAKRPHQQCVTILFFHGVLDRITDPLLQRNFLQVQEFRRRVLLLRDYPIIRLDWLPYFLAERSSARNAVCITVDDGHESSLTMADVLHDARVPWSLFVSTGTLGSGRTLWPMKLSLLLLHGRSIGVELLGRWWSLINRSDRELAFRLTRTVLKNLPAEQRRRELRNLEVQFPKGEVERLLAEWPCARTLAWPDVIGLHHSGVLIGSHGVHHEVHHARQPSEVRRKELDVSRRAIETRLETACRVFAFPNGDTAPSSERELVETGYTIGLTTVDGCATTRTSVLALPRVAQDKGEGIFCAGRYPSSP